MLRVVPKVENDRSGAEVSETNAEGLWFPCAAFLCAPAPLWYNADFRFMLLAAQPGGGGGGFHPPDKFRGEIERGMAGCAPRQAGEEAVGDIAVGED